MSKIIRITAADGTKVVYDPKKHLCTMDGEPVPSSTRVLRRASDAESFSLNYARIEAAGKLGSHVHYLTELLDAGKKVTEKRYLPLFFKDHPDEGYKEGIIKRVGLSLRGWENFRNDHQYDQPKSLIEQFVYSVKHRLSGIIDRVALMKSRPWIVDLKTGILKPEAWLQTGCYAGTYEELFGDKVAGRIIVQLPGTATKGPGYKLYDRGNGYKPFKRDPWRLDWHVFLSKLISWRWDKENL